MLLYLRDAIYFREYGGQGVNECVSGDGDGDGNGDDRDITLVMVVIGEWRRSQVVSSTYAG